MNRLFLSLLLGVLVIQSAVLKGQTIDHETLEAQIDAMVPAGVNDTTPGLVVGIVKNGELIFSKGYGLANISYGIPNNPKMVFNTGSVSKQFTALAVLSLVDKGLLSLNDSINLMTRRVSRSM